METKVTRRLLTPLQRAIEYTEKASRAIGSIPITDDPGNVARDIFDDMQGLIARLKRLYTFESVSRDDELADDELEPSDNGTEPF